MIGGRGDKSNQTPQSNDNAKLRQFKLYNRAICNKLRNAVAVNCADSRCAKARKEVFAYMRLANVNAFYIELERRGGRNWSTLVQVCSNEKQFFFFNTDSFFDNTSQNILLLNPLQFLGN